MEQVKKWLGWIVAALTAVAGVLGQLPTIPQ